MINVYDTLVKEKQEFKSIKPNKVGIYHCGPTVYWTQHIGNLRGMFCADVVVRTFKYLGYKVNLVRNYTDVGHLTSDQDEGEDKMQKAAQREGLDPMQIAEKYIQVFENDTRELNLLEPNEKPRATKHIKEMIKMVQVLLEKDFAYTTDLAVYFDTSKVKNYTQLSGQDLEQMQTGAGKGEVSDPGKKNPTDFALWFFKAGVHEHDLQTWESPFKSSLVSNGEGFPGWHIECSAMAKKYLGDTFDIHMGGVEHISVHHTNEIAQSESANGVKFVNYWLHNEHLLVDNKKMSKSEGTGYSLEEIKQKGYDPLVLKYFFLQAHYRSKQNFTWQALDAAKNGLNNLYDHVKTLGTKKGEISEVFKNKFIKAISDDFNSAKALAVAWDLLKSEISSEDKLKTILDFDKMLGLNLDNIYKQKMDIPKVVMDLVKQRQQARQDKDWELADKLREEIEAMGFEIEDAAKGVNIKIKN